MWFKFFFCLTLVVFASVVSHLIYILPVWVLNYSGFIPGRTILLFQWDKTGQSSSIVKLGKIFVIVSGLWDSCVTCKQKIGRILFKFSQMFSGVFFWEKTTLDLSRSVYLVVRFLLFACFLIKSMLFRCCLHWIPWYFYAAPWR